MLVRLAHVCIETRDLDSSELRITCVPLKGWSVGDTSGAHDLRVSLLGRGGEKRGTTLLSNTFFSGATREENWQPLA